MGHTDVLGRDAECRDIDAMLEHVRHGGSRALVIRGEAGIGKSALIEYAVTRADGMRVLRARGYESESALPFAGLADLLTPVTDRLGALPEPQRVALEATLALRSAQATSHFAVCAGTLSLLAAAAEGQPLLVAIDDAQWLDASSATAIRFTARRLRGEGVALLMAVRAGPDERAFEPGLPELRLSGLDFVSARMVMQRSSTRHLTDGEARQLFAVTSGNPLALIEMPRLFDGDPLPDTAPPPAGATLERIFHRRLDGLDGDTRAALTIAAADQSGELAPITLALDAAGLGLGALAAAEAADIVHVNHSRVSFQHPLLRSTVYHSAAAASRSAAHAALAQAYRTLPGGRASDAHAWHLAAATLTPDAEVARILQEAGQRARLRGAYVEAARALERAAELSPAPEARARRLTQAAKAWQLAGHIGRAGRLLVTALELTADPLARAEIQHLRGYVRMWREAPAGVSAHLEREAAAIEAIDPDRAAMMLADAAVPAFMTGELVRARDVAARAWRTARRGGAAARRLTDVTLAVAHATRGDRAEAAELLGSCRDWLDTEQPLHNPQSTIFAAITWMWLGDHTAARQLIDRLTAACRHHSALGVLPYALGLTAALDFRTGRWQIGIAHATESVQLAAETHQANAYGVCFLAHIQAAMGQREKAERNLRRTERLAEQYGIGCMPLYTESARGLLELGHGDVEAALEHLRRVDRLAGEQGLLNPTVVLWPGDLAEALVRSGASDEAAAVLARTLRPAAAAGSQWAAAVTARVEGLLDGTLDASDHFERALALHADLTWPFEQARTALCYGEVLRRNRQRVGARVQLREALRIFDVLNAEPWAARAGAELRATGEHARSQRSSAAFELTPQELQVALIVAEGATNQEVASALFLSTKTIEYHLSKIYRKAGLSSRDQLAELIAQQAA